MGDLLVKAQAPLLALALPHVGHAQTRSRGTLGGSMAHADPSAEIPLALTVAGGSVELGSRAGRRRVPAAEFVVGPMTTSRRPDELVAALHWPVPPTGARHGFVEHAMREGDFAIAAVAVTAACAPNGRLTALSIGLGGVDDCVVMLDARAFVGEQPDAHVRAAIADAAGRLEARSDAHASVGYRQMLARSLTLKALAQALGELP
jgi:CO/xanthine dehydrogenase FAD-binding subunit